MKKYLTLTIILFVEMLIIPFIINIIADCSDTEATSLISTETQAENEVPAEETIKVMLHSTGKVQQVNMLEYIIGCVAGEMPASFSQDALKAQAIACYTYAKYIKENSSESEFDITDSSDSHQCYISQKEQKTKWGNSYDEYRLKIENAVKSVFGELLTYNGKTAMTVFHSNSVNKTNSAAEIWGEDIPYLISVKTDSSSIAENTESTASLSAENFKEIFEEYTGTALNENDVRKWAKVKEKNADGYIRTLQIGQESFSCDEIKIIYSLASVNFKAKLENNTFIFTVYGKGHGVGMSQYGAEAMALQGKSYKEILAHFYPGTKLVKE